MFNLKKIFGTNEEKLSKSIDFGVLAVDMHSHLIPGIDDGAKTMEESIDLISELKSLGFQKLITTPHIQVDRFKNNPEIIKSGLDALRVELDKNGIEMEIEAAAEYLVDDGFAQLLRNKELMTFGNNFVLIELSYFTEPWNLKNVIFEAQTEGYNLILAHPERYSYWHNDFSKIQELHDRGVFLQMNINSLTGWYSPQSKKTAEKLIDANIIRFLGTDTHNHVYLNELKKSTNLPYMEKVLSSGKILNKSLLA